MTIPPLLDLVSQSSIFIGGMPGPHQLDHPAGLCIDPLDQAIWCGGEAGQLYRIPADANAVEVIASTGGCIMGMAIDRRGQLYLCDVHHQAVFVYDRTGECLACLEGREKSEVLRQPHSCVLSADERHLYVTNTCSNGGPGIWRFDLTTGKGILWMRDACEEACGLTLTPKKDAILLVERQLPGINRIPILQNGEAGPKELFLPLNGERPDGITVSPTGQICVSNYCPSKIFLQKPGGKMELLMEDNGSERLHHPMHMVFRGTSELLVANWGGWHLTRIDFSSLCSDVPSIIPARVSPTGTS